MAISISRLIIELVLVKGGLAKFIFINQYVYFPGEGYNFSFTNNEFHIVNSVLSLYRVSMRL